MLAGCAAAGAGDDPALVDDAGYPAPARPVRSPAAAPIASESALERLDEPGRVAELLLLVPGQRIAVLEAGAGYYALRFARALGPSSPVTAVEADPSDAALIQQRSLALEVPWLATAVSTSSDPRLPPGGADLAIIADAYATIPEPYAYFARLGPVLAGSGRLAVVDHDVDVQLGGMPLAIVRCELEMLGYRLNASYRLLPADRYLAVFSPPERPVPPAELRPCVSDGGRTVHVPGR